MCKHESRREFIRKGAMKRTNGTIVYAICHNCGAFQTENGGTFHWRKIKSIGPLVRAFS